jgi:hypothetical protein
VFLRDPFYIKAKFPNVNLSQKHRPIVTCTKAKTKDQINSQRSIVLDNQGRPRKIVNLGGLMHECLGESINKQGPFNAK